MCLVKKCKLFECYDIDGEYIYTFKNRISNLGNGNICIPIIKSKYNDNSFLKLAFIDSNIRDNDKVKHILNIEDCSTQAANDYLKPYENYDVGYKEIELQIFETREDYANSSSRLEYYCILEDYEYYNFKTLKTNNLVLNYEYYGEVKFDINLLSRIKIDLSSSLVSFFCDKGLLNEIYVDISSEKDTENEINIIKNKLYDIGFEKFIVDNSIKNNTIDLNKIKAKTIFKEIDWTNQN